MGDLWDTHPITTDSTTTHIATTDSATTTAIAATAITTTAITTSFTASAEPSLESDGLCGDRRKDRIVGK